MAEDISIRRATSADLDGAAALAARLVVMHHEVDPERFFLPDNVEQGYAHWFRHELARREAVILVALAGDEIIGYAYGTLEARDWNLLLDRHAAIHDIFVVDSARGRGAGLLLMQAIIGELEALGAPRIVLSTMVGNQNAQRLFERAGFRRTMLEMTRGG
jgi:ribosomal protein S18 acetylase RimI-like enzyme